MRAILVSVDYTDLLRITLPFNRKHYEEVWIVTDNAGCNEVLEVAESVDGGKGITVLATDLFYRHGASFNKFLALEWGLDQMGRHGWLCLMDADVLWPQDIKWYENDRWLELDYPASQVAGLERSWEDPQFVRHHFGIKVGYLMTPLRRMFTRLDQPLPPESEWGKYPVHRNVREWAGYSQIFHASDPVLGKPPWHETNWVHAGGADSEFQRKWDTAHKVRPPWECLHLGPAGENWHGRATPYMGGGEHPHAGGRREKMRQVWHSRRVTGSFDSEKLK